MRTKECAVIGDLLPLYVDDVCSEESRRLVSEHLERCAACRALYEDMGRAVERTPSDGPELDSARAFDAIHHRWKRKKRLLVCLSVVLTALIVSAGYLVVQNVSAVHDRFFPSTYAYLRDLPDDAWQRVRFGDGADVLVFDSVFYDKEVTLDANGDGPVQIRILDGAGDTVLEETVLEPGTSLSLDRLADDTAYLVEVKTTADFVLLDCH